MTAVWEEKFSAKVFRKWVAQCVRFSFGSITFEGLENIPDTDKYAVILAPNHCAALIDPLIHSLLFDRPVVFGARSDIFSKPTIARILNDLHILPIARERNGYQEVAKNYKSFNQAVESLRHGVPFCLYAEGTHRAQRGMLPVKKGIFRIAEMACQSLDKPVFVIPIGSDYEFFFRQFGRLRVRIGKPIPVNGRLGGSEGQSAETFKNLCSELQNGILSLLKGYDDEPGRRIALRIALSAISLPLFVICTVLSFPIWLPSRIILSRIKDKAWTQTVFYCCRFFFPILWPFNWMAGVLGNMYYRLIKDIQK